MQHKVLLIGAGSICPAHIQAFGALGDRAKVVGIVARHTESARQAIEAAGLDAVAYTDYRQAIEESGCDIVSVMTPPDSHCEITVWALEHGCHVLVEKPMAPSLAECDTMLDAARRTGNQLAVVAQSRCLTPIWWTKQLLDSGLPGKLLYTQVNSLWYRGRSYYDLAWRGSWATEGGGCTLVHAVHHIDLLAWMAGMPRQVTAMIGNVAHTNSEEEDLSMAMLRFDDGSFAQLTANLVSHGQKQALSFACENAVLEIPHALSADTPQENGFPRENTALLTELEAAYAAMPPLAYEGHAGLADNLLRAVDEGVPLISDGQAGRNTMELIMAIYKSASENAPVTLPITPDDPFYTRAGVQTRMPHFYKKTGFLSQFTHNEITLASSNMG